MSSFIKELLCLWESTSDRSDANKEHVSPDDVIHVTVDFLDPEERELTIWVKGAKSSDEAEALIENNEQYRKFIEEILQPFDLSIYDGSPTDDEELEDGWSLHIEFPPEEEND